MLGWQYHKAFEKERSYRVAEIMRVCLRVGAIEKEVPIQEEEQGLLFMLYVKGMMK